MLANKASLPERSKSLSTSTYHRFAARDRKFEGTRVCGLTAWANDRRLCNAYVWIIGCGTKMTPTCLGKILVELFDVIVPSSRVFHRLGKYVTDLRA
jgi:hypothetical protein